MSTNVQNAAGEPPSRPPFPCIVMAGFGNIAQASLALLRREFPHHRLVAFDKLADAAQRRVAESTGVLLQQAEITRGNYRQLLAPWLRDGGYLLNLATELSSVALITLAQEHGAWYLDTCIDPWSYEPSEDGHGLDTSNYELREQVLQLARQRPVSRSAIVAHGANPGYVSVLLKVALETMAERCLPQPVAPAHTRADFGQLAERLGIRVVQISECDTQVALSTPADDEFRCTWSPAGLLTEALQNAELGWGTHETRLPAGASEHHHGCRAAIKLDQRSVDTRVKSWSPNRLDFDAWCISHNEAVSIADYLSLHEAGRLRYRPTCYYAYRPCDDAAAALERVARGEAGRLRRHHVLKDELVSGIDELGVFLLSDRYPALWAGSNLSIARARALLPHNNATSLQVVAPLVAAMRWMHEHPEAGVIESEALDHREIHAYAAPYWGPMLFESVHWRPRRGDASLEFAAFATGQAEALRP